MTILESTRQLAAGLVLVTAAVSLGGCPGCQRTPTPSPGAGAESPRRGGSATIGFTADMGSVNPYSTLSTATNQEVSALLFLSLADEQTDFTDHPPTFAPSLAESWESSADGKELTFHLRPGLTWSDGVPITADDVRFTWQVQVSQEVAWDGSYYKSDILDVVVVDPQTARFVFSQHSPHQMLRVNEGPILPKHAWSKLPFDRWRVDQQWFVDNLVTSGPFQLARWVPQQEIVLARNPRYYQSGKPYLDRLIVRIVPEMSTLVTELLTGSLDMIFGITPADVARVERSQHLKVLTWWSRAYAFVAWNNQRPPFDSPRVRQALTLAIDREAISETVYGRYGRISVSPILSDMWAFDRSLEAWPYDSQRALALLAEDGFADHDGDGILDRNGKPFAFDLLTNAGNPQRADAVILIQEQLKRVGIEARPRFQAFNPLMEQADRGDYDAILMRWTMPTDLDLSFAFHSEMIGRGNVSGYRSAATDALLAQGRDASDLDEFGTVLRKIQQTLHQDQPLTLLYEAQDLAALNTRLRGPSPNALRRFWHAADWWRADLEP
jgi:peptide/nickel transport system substrate-binding protein